MKNKVIQRIWRLVFSACLIVFAVSGSWAIDSILGTYQNYDMNSDGIIEIESLELMDFEDEFDDPASSSRLVIVFVESRLMDVIPGSAFSVEDVEDCLIRFKGDLRAEGYYSYFVLADVYGGAVHQDGRTLLAMRRFLQDVKASYSMCEGTILIGSFPDSTLVRRWLWKWSNENVFIGGVDVSDVELLRVIPEMVDPRADIVLGDMDGDWESIYNQGQVNLEGILARPKASMGSGWFTTGWFQGDLWDITSHQFRDFFWIRDDQYSNYGDYYGDGVLWLYINTALRNPELSSADLSLPNPIARPELFVSRINPLHIAVNPDPSVVDPSGNHLLDASGKPQAIDIGYTNFNWVRDSSLERKILVDFFNRNHHYRVGGTSNLTFRAGAIAHPATDFSVDGHATYVSAARPDFGTALKAPVNPTLLDYVNWWKVPAILRAAIAHSSPWNTGYSDAYVYTDLETAAGGHPWRWRLVSGGGSIEPSFEGLGGCADLFLHRTLWENNTLKNAGPSIMIHSGCETYSPQEGGNQPYTHPTYGTWQNAEGQLFYLNGLALISRAKGFNDSPEGLSEAFNGKEKAGFGALWHEYFDIDSQNSGLASNYAANKKSYNWTVIGDFSVRLRYNNGLGIMTGDTWKIKNTYVHPNNAWIDGWNFGSADNWIEGAGDFDGNGIDEFILHSAWGLGIAGHNGSCFYAPVVKPKDTWFGSWRLDATIHSAKDVIRGTGDFNGDGKDEILITSEWGMGILRKSGSSLTSIVTRENNTYAGSWLYETTNKICAIADFDNDGKDEILVTSSSKIGLLKLSGSTFTSPVVKPTDTWFGDWRFNAANDVIAGTGDFNADGTDDILIRSAWGLGLLKLSGSTFTSYFTCPDDTWLGSWRLNASIHSEDDKIAALGNVNGANGDDIVITSEWGLGVLEFNGTALASNFTKENNQYMGSWKVNTASDKVVAAGDFTGDGRVNVVFKNGSKIGMMRNSGNNQYIYYPITGPAMINDWYFTSTDTGAAAGNFDSASPGLEWIIKK